MCALVDCAGTVAEIHAGHDVEIGQVAARRGDREEVVSIRNGDVVKPAGKRDCIKVIRRCRPALRHDRARVVEFSPACGQHAKFIGIGGDVCLDLGDG